MLALLLALNSSGIIASRHDSEFQKNRQEKAIGVIY